MLFSKDNSKIIISAQKWEPQDKGMIPLKYCKKIIANQEF